MEVVKQGVTAALGGEVMSVRVVRGGRLARTTGKKVKPPASGPAKRGPRAGRLSGFLLNIKAKRQWVRRRLLSGLTRGRE